MNPGPSPAVLWITVQRASRDGRTCREYTVYDHAGAPTATALAFPWNREIPVLDATHGSRLTVLRRRRTFPISGKVDILDDALRRIGIVSRNGRCRDGVGQLVGRFRDDRSGRARTGEALLAGALDAALGGASTSDISSPAGFLWIVQGQSRGSLRRASLPFPAADEPEEQPAPHPLRRWLPRRIADRLPRLSQPRAWRFEQQLPASDADPRLLLAATLFTIELAHW